MRSFTLQPIVISTTRMSDRQDHDEIHADLENYNIGKSQNSNEAKVEMYARKSFRIRLNVRNHLIQSIIEILCSTKRPLSLPLGSCNNFIQGVLAKFNHRRSFSSRIFFTSDHGTPGVGSLARRFSSSRSLGSSIDMPGIGSWTESNNSVAKRMRSASGSERADLRISSCETDMRSSMKKKLKENVILLQNLTRGENTQ